MKTTAVVVAASLLGAAILIGCGGDDVTLAPEAGADGGGDAHPRDGTVGDGPTSDITSDVAKEATSDADAALGPQRVLVTSQGSDTSELVAVNVAMHTVDGTLSYPGFGTTDAHSKVFPFVLEQENNIVGRLDALRPWIVDSSWNVLLKDGIDGGFPYTDPFAAVVGAGDTTYVLRYNRNDIAVINALQMVDAGKPLHTIDLSSLVQAGGDGAVEMTGGVYVAAKNLVYVVLGNINQNTVLPPTYDLLCTDTTSTVIGIDTTKNAVANLGGSGPGGSIPLKGFDPVIDGIVYDEMNNRLLILEAGCNKPGTSVDAGPGPVLKRGVEAVNLADLTTTILIDTSSMFASGSGYPSGIVYISPTQAVLGFDFTGSEVYNWNPTSSTLGSLIPNAPDLFTYDGAGNLLGTSTTENDAGSITSVVSVDIATGKSTTLSANPFGDAGAGIIGGVDVWPHP
jgi:hypothetical protein